MPGNAPGPVAAALRAGPLAEGYKVEQAGSSTVRGLTALNLAGLVTLMVAASAVALGAALVAVDRVSAAAVLREQ